MARASRQIKKATSSEITMSCKYIIKCRILNIAGEVSIVKNVSQFLGCEF